jgi:flagellar basal-body rod protein FlgC
MDPFGIFKVSASGLQAQRMRMNLIASNMANAHTTRAESGGPYKRKDAVFSVETTAANSGEGLEGVKVADVIEDQTPPRMVYDPGHPDADKDGYVATPNISVIEEMANMMMATRAYEANVAAFNISKAMLMRTLEIGR